MHCSGILLILLTLSLGVSCSHVGKEYPAADSFFVGEGMDRLEIAATGQTRVRTTAYTHTEKDSLPYGRKNAVGTELRYNSVVRSAAADWSRFPVGTLFKVEGDKHVYQIDDYGSALVGTNTIDLYKPTKAHMNRWGVRHLDIQVLKWGCWERSAEILEDRCGHRHCREMFGDIQDRIVASEGNS